MNSLHFAIAIVTLILFSGNSVSLDEQEYDIICPSCEQLELRKAGVNESDICHDYYEYICVEDSLLLEVTNHTHHFISNHSVDSSETVTQLISTDAELICSNSQTGDLTYKWKRNGVLVNKILDLKHRTHIADNGSLYIHDIHLRDSGHYSCEIYKDSHLVQTSFVYLDVEYPAVVRNVPKQYLISGQKSVLNCYAKAKPAIHFVMWIKDNHVFHINTTGVSLLPNGSLVFENPTIEHEGVYRCTPFNSHGTHGSSAPIQVVVKEKLNAFAAHDSTVDAIHKEALKKNAHNLFSHRKDYKSKVIKLGKVRAKSSLELTAIDETHADVKLLNITLLGLFSKQRNEQFDLRYKKKFRQAIIQLFQSYSLHTEFQRFKCTDSIFVKTVSSDAKNIIGILPSPNFGKPGDRVFVIGAHYDTVYENPGIDDNGSGSAFVLEASRLLSKQKSKLNATIYFVLFDQEETGLEGSIAFVDEYLIPKVIDKRKAKFVGGFVADMLLLYDPSEDVQTLPIDVRLMCPEAYNWIRNNSFRGDFICAWARDAELFLWNTFKESWNEIPDNRFKALVINAPLAANVNKVPLPLKLTTFYRSDHASFWSSAKTHPQIDTLPTILLSDMGPWRGYQRKCYHQPCDTEIQLTDTNLQFLAHTIAAVVASILKLAAA